MKRIRILAAVGAAVLAACGGGSDGTSPDGAAAARPVGDTAGEWAVLFDGGSLDGWSRVGDANWTLEGDTVRADRSSVGSFLVSDADYADFDLSVEFWVDVPANSGVFIRCQDAEAIGADSCYEVNIYDTRPDPTYRTGSIVDFVAPAATVNTGGRWNLYEISAHGDRLRATLNGVEMYDIEDATHVSGPIALQYGSGTVIFRNVRVRTP